MSSVDVRTTDPARANHTILQQALLLLAHLIPLLEQVPLAGKFSGSLRGMFNVLRRCLLLILQLSVVHFLRGRLQTATDQEAGLGNHGLG